MHVCTAGSRRVFHVLHNSSADVCRENTQLKKRSHKLFVVVLPFGTVWFHPVFVLLPGLKMCKFVYGCDEKSIRVKVVIYRYFMWCTAERCGVVAEFRPATSRNPKLTTRVVNPCGDNRSSGLRHILTKLFRKIWHVLQTY